MQRLLDAEALAAWNELADRRFFQRALAAGDVVGTRRAADAAAIAPPWAGLLEHDRIPFVSYPYEWCFGMLREAARLTLNLLLDALEEGFTLKDASPYNVQWRGASPQFIDVVSFEPLQPGAPWIGYRQFCQLFLNPLLLQAYRDIPFQPWLRGRIDGISPQDCRAAMSIRDWIRPGVLKHVVLQSALEARYQETTRDLRRDLRSSGFHKDLILANVRSLRKLVDGLSWRRSSSTWSDYSRDHAHVEADRPRKSEIVAAVIGARSRDLVWDLGANDGHFSRLASQTTRTVVAMDADPLVIERLYRNLATSRFERILPLVVDLADASPGLGWRGSERKRLEERGRPELVLCLALLHHLVIGANLPLVEVLDWLESLGADLVIEFATKEDPLVRRLLAQRDDIFDDYEPARFEAELGRRFRVTRRENLPSATRTLYVAESRAS